MRCPKCGGPYSKTIAVDKRNSEFEDRILRNRMCDSCGYIFKTIEVFDSSDNPILPALDKAPNTDSEHEFSMRKRKAMKAAKELCYGQAVVDKIQEATCTYEIDQIMKAARNRS